MMRRSALVFSAVWSIGLVWACSDSASPVMVGGTAGTAGVAGSGGTLGVSGSAALPGGSSSLTSSGSAGASSNIAGTGGAGGSSGGSTGGAQAGVGGSSGSAGSAGSGGLPPYVPPVSMVSCGQTPVGGLDPLVADFEDGATILPRDGRGGIWFEYSDGTGTQSSPIPIVASDAGGKAMHVLGKGFTNWGSGIGASIAFDFGNNAQCPYDVSLFDGVSVRVKGSGTAHLRVTQVEMTPTTASDRKGSCDPNREQCEGHYEVAIELTSNWKLHEYKWSDLAQPFGTPHPFDPKAVLGIEFEFHPPDDYDFWLDDVAFLQAGQGAGGAGGAGAGGDSGQSTGGEP